MRVDVHREPNIAVAGQGLGRLGRDVGLAEVRYERMPQAVEIGLEAGMVAVGEEVAALPPVTVTHIWNVFSKRFADSATSIHTKSMA